MRITSLLMLILLNACGIKSSQNGTSNEERLNYLLGFWQDEKNPHNFINFGYSLQDIKEGKGFWGTFPLEAPANYANISSTTSNSRSASYMGGFSLKKSKISCWYKNQEHQESAPAYGEIQIINQNTIKTPIGTFKKLSQAELNKINPNL